MTFPLDITKTRLQIQGQKGEVVKQSRIFVGKRVHRGMLRTLFGISMSLLSIIDVIVISRARGMYGIYCTKAQGREAARGLSTINAMHPECT